MRPDVSTYRNLRITDECLDLFFSTELKEIWMPNTSRGNSFQFNLRDKQGERGIDSVGILRIETEAQFDELFELLQPHSAFESKEDFYDIHRTKTGENNDE